MPSTPRRLASVCRNSKNLSPDNEGKTRSLANRVRSSDSHCALEVPGFRFSTCVSAKRLKASASHDGWAGEATANVVREQDSDDGDDGDDYDRSGGRRPEPRRGDLRSGRDDRKYM